MKFAALIALMVLVAGCGDDTGAERSPEPRDSEPVVLVHETAGGGNDVGTELTPIGTRKQLSVFAGQFSDGLASRIRTAAAAYDVPAGYALAGAVAYIGCGVPD